MGDIERLVPQDARIAVLCGGMSNERDVSLRSGNNCFEALLRLGYENTILIDVDKNIAQTLVEEEIEYAFIVLHGKFGEDGCIQGLLEILDIPYTGCKVAASAIAMNKNTTKNLLGSFDMPLIKSVSLKQGEKFDYNLNYPLMVKPACEGSSIGMSKVENKKDLNKALDEAFKCDNEIIVEEYLEGISTTVGVLEFNGEIIATPILEFRTKTEWYDNEAKYTQGLTEFILPAQISEEMTKTSQELAIKAHNAIGARGVSRVDFLITKDTAYVLEINTIPGMTDLSDLPAQADAMGIDYDTLVQIILNSATLN